MKEYLKNKIDHFPIWGLVLLLLSSITILLLLYLGLYFDHLPKNIWTITSFLVLLIMSGVWVIALLIKSNNRFSYLGAPLIIYVFIDFLELNNLIPILSGGIEYFQAVLVVLSAIWFVSGNLRGRLDITSKMYKDEIKKSVLNIFDSKEFLTTLRSTLPTGKNDKEYGLDFIPYMLHSADERKKHHLNSSKKYIQLLIGSALIFSCVVFYLGYVLLNDDSVGINKQLSDVLEAQKVLIRAFEFATPNLIHNSIYQNKCLAVIRLLDKVSIEEIRKLSLEVQNSPTLDNTKKLLKLLETTKTDSLKEEETLLIRKAMSSIREFTVENRKIPVTAKGTINRLNLLISDMEAKNTNPPAKAAETLKRIAIGVVVSSFFLAILRYIANLYVSERKSAVYAANEEYEIRKFYICLRTAQLNPDSITEVLKTFLGNSNFQDNNIDSQFDNSSIKQLNANFSKIIKAMQDQK